MPRTEILLATYNGEKYLTEQLDSLLQQSWTDWHITISDDASTDHTVCIIEEYVARYPDKMSFLRHGKHFGNARDHFFYLMQQCQEDYMLFCDQDDVWNADKVQITMAELIRAEEEAGQDTPVLVFTDQTPVDVHLRPIADSLMRMQGQDASVIDYRRLILQNIVTGCATGINRALAKLAAQCTDTRDVIMHDWWLGMVAARFGRLVYVDQSTMLYRQHGRNSVGAKDVYSLHFFIQCISRLSEVRKKILVKKQQAGCFLTTYGELLNPSVARQFICETRTK